MHLALPAGATEQGAFVPHSQLRYDRRMRIMAEFAHSVQSLASANRRALRTLLCGSALGALALLSSGCVYRMPIRQGNYLDPSTVTLVRPGMTHSQVRYLLGTPMVPSAFDDSRWDYDYYLDVSSLRRTQRSHVTVFFEKDVVSRIVSDVPSTPITTVTRGGIKYPVAF
jgi:outer membrane protein assembly factor BamE